MHHDAQRLQFTAVLARKVSKEIAISFVTIGFEDVDQQLSWQGVVDALFDGHQLPRAIHEDLYLANQQRGYFNRCAWIDSLGMSTKSVSVFPANPSRKKSLPSIQGAVLLFDDDTGTLQAVIDGELVTKWKTTGDSMLGATLLAPKSSHNLLVLGAGVVAAYQIEAYQSLFPMLENITVWNRNQNRARDLVARLQNTRCSVTVCTDLPQAAAQADIVSSATMTQSPILHGQWLSPKTHVDLIGAFRPDMREADDDVLLRADVYVDSFNSTLEDIGEIAIPLQQGVIRREHILGELYDLCNSKTLDADTQYDNSDLSNRITVFKNGGGGHLDLMCARHIYDTYRSSIMNA